MAYITKGYLDKYISNLGATKLQELRSRPSTISQSQKATYKKSIFLSHSHHDKDLVESVALFLLSQGTYIYVDWRDSSMPSETSAITATIIQSRIRACDEFVVLASNNALDSKWVPWELGFADAAKGALDVFIFPVADNDGTWQGSEYFALYQKIELGKEDREMSVMNEAVVKPAEHNLIAWSLKFTLDQNTDAQMYYIK